MKPRRKDRFAWQSPDELEADGTLPLDEVPPIDEVDLSDEMPPPLPDFRAPRRKQK